MNEQGSHRGRVKRAPNMGRSRGLEDGVSHNYLGKRLARLDWRVRASK